MRSRAGRAARGWVAAIVATTIAAVSHGVADGAFPSLFGFGASLLLAGSAGTLLTARERSGWRLAATVAISQALFHGLFATLGTPSASASATSHHGPAALDATTTMAVATHDHTTMWVAHVIAAAITFVLLRHAESGVLAVARGVRLVAQRLLGWFGAPAIPRRRTIPALFREPRLTRLLLTLSSLRYRGPPRMLGVA